MAQIKDWISAFRLRTLPLALSCILLGGAMAMREGKFDALIFTLALITTLFLQILSNLANDLGDTQNGADSDDRHGPKRAVQTGVISIELMKKALYVFIGLSLISGISLLLVSFGLSAIKEFGFFFLLGVLSISAAIKYTMGKSPYGYQGLGDVFVFLFFGLVGVVGVYFLFTQTINTEVILVASSFGLLSTGVLNINNIRDIKSDLKAGKISIPVRLGAHYAALYHLILLAGAMVLPLVYSISTGQEELKNIWYVVSYPLFVFNVYKIATLTPCQMNPYLKQLALSSFFFAICFSVAINL
jgi:1,4-dihydroxy-2-naphthoate octaprenyltransferase